MKLTNFAKIFETETGQILVYLDLDDDQEPCITVSVKPDGFGVCSIKMSYTSGAGEDMSYMAFSKFSASKAEQIANGILESCKDFT
jgi:hypothetical protein